MQNETTNTTALTNPIPVTAGYKWLEMDVTWDSSTFPWNNIRLQQPPAATELDTRPTYQTSLVNL